MTKWNATPQAAAVPLSPAPREATQAPEKVQRALEIRESSAKAREGKPLAFPTHRLSR